MTADYAQLFSSLFPGFFDAPHIRALPAEEVFHELALDLRAYPADPARVPVPDGVTFGPYRRDPAVLREAVRAVDDDWVQYFGRADSAFCAYIGGKPVSFCLLSGFGEWQGLSVGGPGCVGTVPEYRGQRIGLRMVQEATLAAKAQGYALSWIHYTHIPGWYERLGYRTVLRWGAGGLIRV